MRLPRVVLPLPGVHDGAHDDRRTLSARTARPSSPSTFEKIAWRQTAFRRRRIAVAAIMFA
jgi:hypothetical protein